MSFSQWSLFEWMKQEFVCLRYRRMRVMNSDIHEQLWLYHGQRHMQHLNIVRHLVYTVLQKEIFSFPDFWFIYFLCIWNTCMFQVINPQVISQQFLILDKDNMSNNKMKFLNNWTEILNYSQVFVRRNFISGWKYLKKSVFIGLSRFQ